MNINSVGNVQTQLKSYEADFFTESNLLLIGRFLFFSDKYPIPSCIFKHSSLLFSSEKESYKSLIEKIQSIEKFKAKIPEELLEKKKQVERRVIEGLHAIYGAEATEKIKQKYKDVRLLSGKAILLVDKY